MFDAQTKLGTIGLALVASLLCEDTASGQYEKSRYAHCTMSRAQLYYGQLAVLREMGRPEAIHRIHLPGMRERTGGPNVAGRDRARRASIRDGLASSRERRAMRALPSASRHELRGVLDSERNRRRQLVAQRRREVMDALAGRSPGTTELVVEDLGGVAGSPAWQWHRR